MHVRKTLFFDHNKTEKVKGESKQKFPQVLMMAWKFVNFGLYALSKLKNELNAFSIGLYRDYGLAWSISLMPTTNQS